ncbi:MAG: hypothetical protein NVSMB51_09510 [Solirubrobacteraceae bacterium]
MAVLAMVKLNGDAERILAAKKELMDPAAAQPFRDHGHLEQTVVRTDDGVIVFNLWQDAAGRDRANDEPAIELARRRMVERTGLQPEFASWEVVEHTVTRAP